MSSPFKVKAIYEYASAHDDDLKFSLDQVITVTALEDDDWYEGYYVDDAGTKHEGIFPRNFVEKYEPTAPPRPTRTRTKKEPEPAGVATSSAPAPIPAPAPLTEPEPEPAYTKEEAIVASPTSPKQPVIPAEAEPSDNNVTSPVAPDSPVLKAAEPERLASPPVTVPKMPEPAPAPASASAAPPPKPAPGSSKGGPPPVFQKPANSAFKDRIAAFNKAPAPPPVPKPSGLGSKDSYTIKKPFNVAPPSKDAYVPPPRAEPVQSLYRRDEDPEIREQATQNAEIAERAAAATVSGDGEGEPRPMTVKERMALIQKQQQEQAQRAAEAAAKKDKPKRPPKKRMESHDTAAGDGEAASQAEPSERRDTEDTTGRRSIEETHPPRVPHPGRRKSSKDIEAQDGNEADMSGAGDTEGQESELTEREEGDDKTRQAPLSPPSRPPPIDEEDKNDNDSEEEEEDDEEEEDVDPEVRRKEELRARMAKMSGGMGMPGMFGMMPMPGAAPSQPKKKKPADSERKASVQAEASASPTPRAPPVPTMMAMPGMSTRPQDKTPIQEAPKPAFPEPRRSEERDADEMSPPPRTPSLPVRSAGDAPPVPGGRPAPPPVPTEGRPPPPLPPSGEAVYPPTEGSESDDELSEQTPQERSEPPLAPRAPPPLPVTVPAPAVPTSPPARRRSQFGEEASPVSPTSPQSKRVSRVPPPIPGAAAPALPPAQTRAPPPPPPGGLSRQSTADGGHPSAAKAFAHRDEGDEEVTEYEGDYDTDIASSVPHKDALKSHARESSMEDAAPLRSPASEAPPTMPQPVPSAARAPPPIPTQPPPDTRPSAEMPRAPPPPPPAPKDTPKTPRFDDDYDPYNYTATSPSQGVPIPGFAPPPPAPVSRVSTENVYSAPDLTLNYPGSPQTRPPPPAPPSASNRHRQSTDVSRPSGGGRRSMDVTRPSMESGFVANELDLAPHTAWYVPKNTLPPQLQGRKDIFIESEESQSSANGKPQVTRDIWILYTDYSQTVITATFDPTASTPPISLSQRHEPPPRALRQDQLETAYERFGRPIADAVAAKKDTVVGDGTPHGLIYELLRPHKDALLPVGTRAFGALVYSNLANASTTQNDEIRPGDIMSVRNARFQGKHGAMHAKYSVEVGKPDHVAVVGEWDGTKKKVRAWEQGRESKKVKLESFKLDDLRSGEVKIWRVMERGWVGWEGVN